MAQYRYSSRNPYKTDKTIDYHIDFVLQALHNALIPNVNDIEPFGLINTTEDYYDTYLFYVKELIKNVSEGYEPVYVYNTTYYGVPYDPVYFTREEYLSAVYSLKAIKKKYTGIVKRYNKSVQKELKKRCKIFTYVYCPKSRKYKVKRKDIPYAYQYQIPNR